MPTTLPSPHHSPPRASSATFSFSLPTPTHHPTHLSSSSKSLSSPPNTLSLPFTPSPSLPHPSTSSPHPLPPPSPLLHHAEAAVLDTLFSLLLNLSIVALIAGIVLVIGVVRLPARSTAVTDYNAQVSEWEGRIRGQFQGVQWTVGGRGGGVMQAREAGVDQLNDVGSDLLSYSPLLYSFNASIVRPSGRFTGHPQGVTEAATLSLSATPVSGAGHASSAFNLTLALIKKVNRAVTQHLCTAYSGVWKPLERTCDYHVGLREACVRVLLDEASGSWQLYDAAEKDGVYRPKAASNATDEQHMVEEAAFGCGAFDAAKDEGRGGWDVGSYEPLNEDPYATSTKATLSVATVWKGHSGGTQRRLLSADNSTASSSSSTSPSSSSTGPSSSSSASTSASASSSSSTAPPTSSPVVIAVRTLEPVLLIRHYRDPFLFAQRLTHDTLWFGLARHSIFILSLLCFALAAAAMMGKAGTRVEWCCGLVKGRVQEWWDGKRGQWEEQTRKVGQRLSGVTKKARGRRKGYTNVGSEDATPGLEEGEEQEEDVTLEMKEEEGDVEDEVKMREEEEGVGKKEEEEPSVYEIGDLEEAEEEEETRQREVEEEAVSGGGREWAGEEKRGGVAVVVQPVTSAEGEAVDLGDDLG